MCIEKPKSKMIKEFTLGAVKWVIEQDNSSLEDKKAYGFCDYTESLIRYQNETKGALRNDLAIEQTIYHEVVHAILDTLGYDDISNDETFVQQFSLLLHQFEKTKK